MSKNGTIYICVCVCVYIYTHASVLSCSVLSDTLRPNELQPSRLPCPWNFPGKNTKLGFHFLLQLCIYISILRHSILICILYICICTHTHTHTHTHLIYGQVTLGSRGGKISMELGQLMMLGQLDNLYCRKKKLNPLSHLTQKSIPGGLQTCISKKLNWY